MTVHKFEDLVEVQGNGDWVLKLPDDIDWNEGDEVELEVVGDSLVIRRVQRAQTSSE